MLLNEFLTKKKVTNRLEWVCTNVARHQHYAHLPTWKVEARFNFELNEEVEWATIASAEASKQQSAKNVAAAAALVYLKEHL